MPPHLIIILTLSLCALLLMLLFAVRKRNKKSDPIPSPDLVEFVSRHRFFQGQNLEMFTKYLQEKDWEKIEQMIIEKFETQGKINARELAVGMVKKFMRFNLN